MAELLESLSKELANNSEIKRALLKIVAHISTTQIFETIFVTIFVTKFEVGARAAFRQLLPKE